MAVVRAFDRVNRTGEPISQLKGVLDLARQAQLVIGAEPSQLDIVPLVLHLLRTPEKRE